MADGPQPFVFEACFNFCDLGGYETTDGRRVKSGAVFRSDSLHRLTSADLDVMTSMGLRTVIDMRSSGDLHRQGRYALADEITYPHLPSYEYDTRPFQLSQRDDPTPDVASAYLDLVVVCKDAVAAALESLAEEDHPIVFYCVAGKDRTGIVAALLLSVLGVPAASIVADYHLTEGAADRRRAWADAHDPEVVLEIESTPAWVLRAPATTMGTFLQLVRDHYGSVDQFLTHLGIRPDTTEVLRHRLLD